MDISSPEVVARIKASNKVFSKQEQKAELLKRNRVFLAHLKELEIRIKNECHGLDIKTITRPGAFNKFPEFLNDPVHPFKRFDREFRRFCSGWGIYLDWDGSLDKLSSSLQEFPFLKFHHLAAESLEIDYTRFSLPKEDDFYSPSLYI